MALEEVADGCHPLCQPLIEAIGFRMAYEAAVQAQVEPSLLSIYEIGCIEQDSSWYSEHGLSREAQRSMEERAFTEVAAHLERLLDNLGAEPYATAPILSRKAWIEFTQALPVFCGRATGIPRLAKESEYVELSERSRL